MSRVPRCRRGRPDAAVAARGAAPASTLRPLVVCLVAGTALLVPSLLLLYGMFQSDPGEDAVA